MDNRDIALSYAVEFNAVALERLDDMARRHGGVRIASAEFMAQVLARAVFGQPQARDLSVSQMKRNGTWRLHLDWNAAGRAALEECVQSAGVSEETVIHNALINALRPYDSQWSESGAEISASILARR